jgi:hypothetical protein
MAMHSIGDAVGLDAGQYVALGDIEETARLLDGHRRIQEFRIACQGCIGSRRLRRDVQQTLQIERATEQRGWVSRTFDMIEHVFDHIEGV